MADDYYRPFLASDSEESDAESIDSRPSNANPDYIDERMKKIVEAPNFKAFAASLKIVPPTLPEYPLNNISTMKDERYAVIDRRTSAYPYDSAPYPPTNIPKDSSTSSKVQSVIVLRSRDRDRSVYPQPTSCQLFLPRDYKNVIGFSITDMSLISAFFYFSNSKVNVAIQIFEKDNVYYQPITVNPKPQIDMSGTNLIITNNIREGSYNIIQLLAELNIQLNKVPVFYDFLNGYSDFRTIFQVNGDFSINFNYPGDYYYDSVKDVYIQNPTRSQIVGFYFQSQFANQITFTEPQIRVAYYYPVLKEALVDPTTDLDKIDFSGVPSGQTQAQTISNLVYSFQGINDPVAYTVIMNNLNFLDTYRVQHTFRYSLVNRYVCNYDQTNNYVSIQATSLNTSLVNLLNAQYNIYLTQQLIKYNLTAAQYNSLSGNNAILQSILQDMYNYLQVNFAKSFAINFGSFGLAYYSVASNTILIRDGEGAAGIYTSYNASVSTVNTNFTDQFRINPPALWPRMRNLSAVEGPPRNMGSSDPAILFPVTSNYPYSLALSNIDLSRTQHFVDSNGNVYVDSRRGAGDILVNVDPGKYTIFQFRSKYRQTLQIESMPRQTNWRYPLWNKNNPVNYPLQTLFDISYCYVAPGDNNSAPINKVTPSNISFRDIQGWANIANTDNNYSYSFDQSAALWSSTDQLNVNNPNGLYYTFQTPLPVSPTIAGSNVYRYPMNLTFQPTSNFPDLLYAFLYHDIAAFSADVSLPYIRKESPIHYKQVIEIPSASSNITFSFKSYANQQYYLILRPSTVSPVAVDYKIVPWINNTQFSTLSYATDFNPTADPATLLDNFNVAKNADYDFIRMPNLPSTLWATPSPSTATVNEPLPTIETIPLGYDVSGVSNDLTDYLPFSAYAYYSTINPIAKVRADPITNYIFQYNTPFDPDTQSYFDSDTNNTIMSSNASQRYTLKNVPLRQYKILNYYATTYIQDNGTVQPNPADITPYLSPYSAATTSNTQLNGYTYLSANTPDKQVLQLGSPGMCGFMFLPNDGIWAFDRITFKSSFINPTNDLNNGVHALAVFITSEIYSQPASGLNLSNALAICLKTSTSVYSNDNSLNIGFDSGLGTYYTYSNYPDLVIRPPATSVISGFSQNPRNLISDPSSYYSIVAFRFPDYDGSVVPAPEPKTYQYANASPTTLHYVTGSPIPYPYASGAYPSSNFYDGQAPPTKFDVVVANPLQSNIYGPPRGIDRSMSVYEQSIPYVNSHIHYLQKQSFYENSNAYSSWSNLPIIPTFLHASVPNYVLLQNGSFVVATYSNVTGTINTGTDPQRSFTLKGQLTSQQIFPEYEMTSLIGVSGTSRDYCFLGAMPITNELSQLRFKLYDPDTGILIELPRNPQYTFSNNLLLQHFVFHDTYRWFLSAIDMAAGNAVLQGDSTYNIQPGASYLSYTFTNIVNTELQMDPTNIYMYFAKYANPLTGFTNMTLYSFDPANPGYIGSGTATNPTTGYQISLETGGNYPPFYNQISVDDNNGSEELIFLSSYQPNNFFELNSYIVTASILNSNATMNKSVQTFLDESKNPIIPSRIIGGANGSKWTIFTQAPYIMGNRNDAYDAPIALNIAWQIFFPTIKIELRKLANESSPMTDLTNLTYPEWPHTAMFAYSNFNTLSNDIGINSATGSWGNENRSNFMVSDVSFNGFYFNSYMMNVPLLPNQKANPLTSNDNNDYYVAVRGWLPTEKFQTMLRFYLPNRYDFGYVRFLDLSGEVSTLQNIANLPDPPLFSPTYSQALLSFNSNFTFTNKTFGTNIVGGYPGSTINSVGFGDFLNKYTNIYNTFSNNSQVLANIQSSLTNSINNYIATDLKYILPPSALTRQRYSDPLLFQIQWKSQLTPRFLTIEDEWGLGWNLGYPKQDTPFATIQTAPSFYKIQQSYIYLRLNPEFNINRMDSGGKESYRESREPTGITNQYYCKLLLASFGANATTFIHNPITFQTPIHRLSKLEFQWIDANGIVISNNDAEWNMSVNITEYIDTVPTPLKTLNTLSNIV